MSSNVGGKRALPGCTRARSARAPGGLKRALPVLAEVLSVVSWKPAPLAAELPGSARHTMSGRGLLFVFNVKLLKTRAASLCRGVRLEQAEARDPQWLSVFLDKPHFGQRAGKPNVVLVEGHQLLSRRVFLFPVMVANNSTGGHLAGAG